MINFLKRISFETVTYWGAPAADGYGGYTFATPVQIDCRWEDRAEIITDTRGKEIVSKAVIFVTEDLDEGGYLFRGTSVATDPRGLGDEIKRFDKIPSVGGANNLRVAYL
jgi:hypothetical protein